MTNQSRPLRGRGDPVILLKMDLFESLWLLEILDRAADSAHAREDELDACKAGDIYKRLYSLVSARQSGRGGAS